jgi:hypothetical protein
MGNYEHAFERMEPNNRPYGDSITNTPVEPKQEVFGREKVSDYLREALNTSDTNSDGILSRTEFNAARLNDKAPLDKQTSEFISKHFGTLSLLSTDGVFSEGGISSRDISNVAYGDTLESARNSYSQTYRDFGGRAGAVAGSVVGFGAQVADFAFTGGGVTLTSTLGHMGAAAVLPWFSKERVPPLALMSGIVGGMMWGPLYGGIGGYEGGKRAGDSIASSYFQSNHAPHISAMLKELNTSTGEARIKADVEVGNRAQTSKNVETKRDFEDAVESMAMVGGKFGLSAKASESDSNAQSVLFNEAMRDSSLPSKYYEGQIEQKNEPRKKIGTFQLSPNEPKQGGDSIVVPNHPEVLGASVSPVPMKDGSLRLDVRWIDKNSLKSFSVPLKDFQKRYPDAVYSRDKYEGD